VWARLMSQVRPLNCTRSASVTVRPRGEALANGMWTHHVPKRDCSSIRPAIDLAHPTGRLSAASMIRQRRRFAPLGQETLELRDVGLHRPQHPRQVVGAGGERVTGTRPSRW
jgi:hypothetical protein